MLKCSGAAKEFLFTSLYMRDEDATSLYENAQVEVPNIGAIKFKLLLAYLKYNESVDAMEHEEFKTSCFLQRYLLSTFHG